MPACPPQQLQFQGKNPTIEQIRQILKTGSSTTIANHLKNWKESQSSQPILSDRENVPESLITAAKGLWERMMLLSDDRFKEIHDEHQQSIAEIQKDLDKYRRNNQRWQQLYYHWHAEKASLREEQDYLEDQLTASRNECQEWRVRAARSEEQLKDKQQRIKELQQQFTQFQQSMQEDRQREQEQFSEQKRIIQEALNTLKDELSSARQLTSKYQGTIDELESKQAVLNREYQQLDKALTQEQQKSKQKNDLYEQLQQQYQIVLKNEELLKMEIYQLVSEQKAAKQTIETLTHKLETHQQENRSLLQEKFVLAGRLQQLEKAMV